MSLVEIHSFEISDAQNLIRWVDGPTVTSLWASRTYTFPLSVEAVARHLERTKVSPQSLMVFKITQGNQTVGHVELDNFDHVAQSVRITRLFVAPPARGQGIARTATELLLKFCFQDLSLNRVEILAIESNAKALRLYEGIGFTREGFLRENMNISGKREGSFILSILKSEYVPTE